MGLDVKIFSWREVILSKLRRYQIINIMTSEGRTVGRNAIQEGKSLGDVKREEG